MSRGDLRGADGGASRFFFSVQGAAAFFGLCRALVGADGGPPVRNLSIANVRKLAPRRN